MTGDELAAERAKYLKVLKAWPGYGGANHGAPLLQLIENMTAGPVLDVGCGDNAFVRALRTKGITGDGVDIAHPQADFSDAADEINAEDGYYEVVTAFDLLEHLSDVDAALREWARVSRQFVVSVAHIPHVYQGLTLHLTVKPREWWLAKLREYSDEVEVIPITRGYDATYFTGTWKR